MTGRERATRTLLLMMAAVLAATAPAATVAAPSSLAAGDPSAAEYDEIPDAPPTPPEPGDPTGPTSPPESDGRVVGTLPLTGVDVLVIAVAAIVLVGSGLALRRLSRADEAQ